jgi:hypothetical protein
VKDTARHIQERFKDKGHVIDLLMVEDPEFQTLCEDFDDCVDALHYWTDSKAPEAEARANEYRTIIKELEEEIIQALGSIQPGQLD